MFSLKGKNAFIIGGTAGLGLTIASSYVESGAKVYIAGRRDEGAAIAEGIGAKFVKVDVTSEQSISDAMDAVEADLGKLDILINNVGVYPAGMLEEYEAKTQDFNVQTNLNSVLWGLKYGPRHMNDGGSIINTSSLLAVAPMPGVGAYSAIKAAVSSLTRTAAIEFGSRGINVNAVMPSTVADTEGNESMDEGELQVVKSLTPLNRAAILSDFVGIYTLLASDEGQFISGQNIAVDGGLTAGVSLGNIEALAGAAAASFGTATA